MSDAGRLSEHGVRMDADALISAMHERLEQLLSGSGTPISDGSSMAAGLLMLQDHIAALRTQLAEAQQKLAAMHVGGPVLRPDQWDVCAALEALATERTKAESLARDYAALVAERDEAIALLTANGLMGGPYRLGLTVADAARKLASTARLAGEMRVRSERWCDRLLAENETLGAARDAAEQGRAKAEREHAALAAVVRALREFVLRYGYVGGDPLNSLLAHPLPPEEAK